MRGGGIAAAAVACTALLAYPTADAAAARLDLDFGRGGKLTIPLPREAKGASFEMERTRGGKIVAIAGHTIVQVLPNGRLNREFGSRGRLTVRPPEGMHFRLGGIALDSQERIVVAGRTSSDSYVRNLELPRNPASDGSWATIIRYLPSGDLDPSFGVEGTVNTDFGLPRVANESNPAPRVSVTGLTVDSEDRPILTGASAVKFEWCYSGATYITHGYVARLTSGGSPDSSFHMTGVLSDTSQQWAEMPLARHTRGIAYFGVENEQCGHGVSSRSTLTAVDGNGESIQILGEAGYFELSPFGTPIRMTLDRYGRILLFGYAWHPPSQLLGKHPRQITRFSPAGALDANFGSGGRVILNSPKRSISLSSFSVDHRARPLLIGTRKVRAGLATGFWLARRTTAGKADRAFGKKGSDTISFGLDYHARAGLVLDEGRGRLLVGGMISSAHLPTGVGLAFARYLGGR
jgi:uncharacterized delta-60 repeat protein